jgi:hypothetical protein
LGQFRSFEIANVPKMRPRTNHFNMKYHHFREEVNKGTISIHYVPADEQIADIFTKTLEEGLFMKLRKRSGSRSNTVPYWKLVLTMK